jgi:signal transduction histidine kinase/CheY-like chemotaxis protein
LLGLADRLLGPGAVASRSGPDLQRARLFVLMLIPFAFVGIALGSYAWFLGAPTMAAAVYAGSGLTGLYVWMLRRGASTILVANLAALQLCTSVGVLVWSNGGTRAPMVFAFAILPMTQLLLLPVRWAVVWATIITGLLVFLGWATHYELVEAFRFADALPTSTVVFTTVVAWTGLGVSTIFYLLARNAREMVERERDSAIAADQAKTMLVADMSHELRTPMNGVIGMLDLVLDAELPEPERNRIRVARDSAVAFVGLLDGITDTTRLDSGRLSLELAPFEPSALVREVVRSLRPSAEARGLTMSFEEPDPCPALEGDGLRIRQVLVNLIGNAIKYTDDGGVTVRSAGGTEGHRWRWTVEIVDTGIGISEADQARVFQRHEQTAEAARRRTGTGLGLAIAARLVEAMGGVMELDSQQGRGTTVCVHIPLRRVTAAAVRPSHESYASLDRLEMGGLVLLVDDDPVNRAVARASLEALGCRVVEAADGDEALERVANTEFDLVLMDCLMPRLDGRSATRRIRAQGLVDRSVPIVALTASVTHADLRACLEAGMDDMLTKPIDRSKLRRVVADALSAKGFGDDRTGSGG